MVIVARWKWVANLCTLGVGLLVCSHAGASPPKPGDILVATGGSPGAAAVELIDPQSAAVTPLVGYDDVGFALAARFDVDGTILIKTAQAAVTRLFRVDLYALDVLSPVCSEVDLGSAQTFDTFALAPDGDYLGFHDDQRAFRLDLETCETDAILAPGILEFPSSIDVAPDGHIIVLDITRPGFERRIFRIAPDGSDYQVVVEGLPASISGYGLGMTVDAQGNAVIYGPEWGNSLLWIATETGAQTSELPLICHPEEEAQNCLQEPMPDLAIEADGSLLLPSLFGDLFRASPNSGELTLIRQDIEAYSIDVYRPRPPGCSAGVRSSNEPSLPFLVIAAFLVLRRRSSVRLP